MLNTWLRKTNEGKTLQETFCKNTISFQIFQFNMQGDHVLLLATCTKSQQGLKVNTNNVVHTQCHADTSIYTPLLSAEVVHLLDRESETYVSDTPLQLLPEPLPLPRCKTSQQLPPMEPLLLQHRARTVEVISISFHF